MFVVPDRLLLDLFILKLVLSVDSREFRLFLLWVKDLSMVNGHISLHRFAWVLPALHQDRRGLIVILLIPFLGLKSIKTNFTRIP